MSRFPTGDPVLSTRTVVKNQLKSTKSPNFDAFYRKSMSLKTILSADFRPEVEVPFLCMRKEKRLKAAVTVNASEFLKYPTLIGNWARETNGLTRILAGKFRKCTFNGRNDV